MKKNKIREVLLIWKVIYRNWRYTFSFIIIVLVFYLLNVLIQNHNYKTLTSYVSSSNIPAAFSLFFSLSMGLWSTMMLSSFLALLLTSVLIGMLFTLIFFKTKAFQEHGKNKKQGIMAGVGIFLGVAAPGCAACGVGLLTLLGIGGGILGSLPLHGMEISLLAIFILAIAIIYTSNSIVDCKTCRVE